MMDEPTRDADRFIAVGDIHACPDQLDEILVLATEYPDHRWVFLGDYLDRGPDAERVITRLRDLDAVFLLGNHEQMFLDRLASADDEASRQKWRDRAGISAASAHWLKTVPVGFHETPHYLFVHGGLDVTKTLDQQTLADYLWIRHFGDYQMLTEKWVIHGHHSVEAPEVVGNRVNINTDSGRGGPLTALVLPEFRFVHSSPTPVPPSGNRLSPAELEAFLANSVDELSDP